MLGMQGPCQERERAGEGGQSSFMIEFGCSEGHRQPLNLLSAPPNNLSTKPDSSKGSKEQWKTKTTLLIPILT